MTELFIYYRIDARQAPLALTAVRRWQRELRVVHPRLVARLLKRNAEPGASEETWMETYSNDPAAATTIDFDPALMAALTSGAPALAPFVVGLRHVETFVSCAW